MSAFTTQIAEEVRKQLETARFTSRNQLSSGRVFFVLKTAATNYTQFVEDHPDYLSGDGVVTVAAVYNTVDAAVGACTADQGDVIRVMPGHTETVTATSLNLDVAGITVICEGTGTNVPFFTYDATASAVDVQTADVRWVGGHFFANKLDVVTAFDLTTAKDFELEGAVFEDSTSSLNFLSIVTTNSTNNDASGLHVHHNFWFGLNTSPAAFISILADEERVHLHHNDLDLASTTNLAHFLTLGSFDITGARIHHNNLIVVGVSTASVGLLISGSGSASTGYVSYNNIASLDATAPIIATTGTGLQYFENRITGVADKSGTLLPVVG